VYVSQLLGVLLLTAIYLAGAQLAAALDSAIPGSIYGLLGCAAAMLAMPRATQCLRPGAALMLVLVPLFLVPITVRMAVRIDFGNPATWRAIAVLGFACLIGVAATGIFARLLLRKEAGR